MPTSSREGNVRLFHKLSLAYTRFMLRINFILLLFCNILLLLLAEASNIAYYHHPGEILKTAYKLVCIAFEQF